jgi:GNAT superfamily N-acetyltransferase
MIRPLKATDYRAVRQLFHTAFDMSEDKNLNPAWKYRNEAASLGIWEGEDTLVAAAIVRKTFLEFIFVDETRRGCGYGTQLLQAVLDVSPALHLTPVNDERVIRWYESQGFHLSSQKGDRKIYVRHPYNLRSKTRTLNDRREV